MTINMIILGHRGEGCTNRHPEARGERLKPRTDPFYEGQILPENSLSAVSSALEHGADGVEFDVFLSRDEIPMVIHDNQLARNVDGYHFWGKDQGDETLGLLSDYTCEELKGLFTIGNGETIPTLDEMIQLILSYNAAYRSSHDSNITINVELKGGAATSRATYAVVRKYLDDETCPLTSADFLFNSFEPECLSALGALDRDARCALGFSTKDLFGEISMPGWVPESQQYHPNTLFNVEELIDRLGLSGLDVVTSDVSRELVALCDRRHLFFNAATNALRLKIEADKYHKPEAEWSELEREKQEVKKLADFSDEYDVLIYYKADNPGIMKTYLNELIAEKQAQLEAGGLGFFSSCPPVVAVTAQTPLQDASITDPIVTNR